MSVLNGNISKDVIFPEEMSFGNLLTPFFTIDEKACCVAALSDQLLVCGSMRKISVYRIDKDGASLVSTLDITGISRQIAVKDGFVFVSARDCGVYVCDMTNPYEPKLVCNIDTVELATGIAVSDNILAVTNRHMGCELYNVSNPYRPQRMGAFMCGEAQSVCFYGHYAVIGDWINKRARIFDIKDSSNIREVSRFDVDGYADGVCTFNIKGRTVCAVGCGHHSAKLKNKRKYNSYTYVTPKMLEDGYGCGHGVEFFDVTNADSPEWLSTLKTPPHFVAHPDTWLVFTDGERVIFTDSMNGVFVISLEDIFNPVFTDCFRLSPVAEQKLSPPSIQIRTASITGAASVGGFLCTASEQEGVHILKLKSPLKPFLTQSLDVKCEKTTAVNNNTFFASKGQIHSFIQYKDRVYCASGNLGIEVLDLNGKHLYSHKTQSVCHDIMLFDECLITAEGSGGVAVYRVSDDRLCEKSRLIPDDNVNVRQIVSLENKIAALSGQGCVLFAVLSKDYELALEESRKVPGLLYYHHLSTAFCDTVIANTLALGAVVVPSKDSKIKAGSIFRTISCPFDNGACGYKDVIISVFEGKYYVCKNPCDENILEVKTENIRLSGQPFVVDGRLVLLNRYDCFAEVINIDNVTSPVVQHLEKLSGHPEFCGIIDGKLYAACGYDGIVKITCD